MKQFFKAVSVGDGNSVLLDGRHLKTPRGAHVELPTRALGEAVAEEWRSQQDEIVPATMPLTRLANTAIDAIPSTRDAVIEQIVAYGKNDLICYRAEWPPELVSRQAEDWDPILAWVARRFGAKLIATWGVVHIAQPDEAISRLRQTVQERSNFALAALSVIASITGSLALTLALAEHHIGTTATFVFSRIDETWQAEKWGYDAEAKERANQAFWEMGAAQVFLSLSRS